MKGHGFPVQGSKFPRRDCQPGHQFPDWPENGITIRNDYRPRDLRNAGCCDPSPGPCPWSAANFARRDGLFSLIPAGILISPLRSPTGRTPWPPGTFTGVIRFTFQIPGLVSLNPSDHDELVVPKFNELERLVA